MNAFVRHALTIRLPEAPAVAPVVAPPAPTSQSKHETADDYSAVLFTSPDGLLRIITCRDHIQWIVQVRRPLKSQMVHPWKAIGYCTSKLGLLRVLRHRRTTPDGMHGFLMTLPERIRRSR